jgi:hypothetical protein
MCERKGTETNIQVINVISTKSLLNPLKPKLVKITVKNSVLTAKKTQNFTVTRISRLTAV